MDNDAQRPSGANGDGRLDVEIALGETLPDDVVARTQVVLVIGCSTSDLDT